MKFFYQGLVFENATPADQVVEREYLFSKDATITKITVSTIPSFWIYARHELSLKLGSESLLSQNPFAPFLLYAGPYLPKLHIPVKAGQRLKASWNVPPGRSYLVFAYREGIDVDGRESFFYVTSAARRDGVTLLQPNIQKNYRWEGLFLYDSTLRLFGPSWLAQLAYPEVVFGPFLFPRLAPENPPYDIDDVVQIRDFPTEFLLDYLPVPSIGGRGPAHFFKSPIPVGSQTVLNIGVASKTKTGGSVTAMVLGTHSQESASSFAKASEDKHV